MAKVLLILRSNLLRDAPGQLLTNSGYSVVGEWPEIDGVDERLELLKDLNGSLILLDSAFCEHGSGVPSIVRRSIKDARIIILGSEADFSRVDPEHMLAADGILTFEISSEMIIQALRLIGLGERVVPKQFKQLFFARSADLPALAPTALTQVPVSHNPALTPRETEILQYLLQGNSNKIIARQLGIAEATVKVHLKSLLRKIRAVNRTQAAIWAVNNGISPKPAGALTPISLKELSVNAMAERGIRATKQRLAVLGRS